MSRSKQKTTSAKLVLLTCLISSCVSSVTFSQSAKHPLTPAEDVGLTTLYQYGGGGVASGGEVIKFSPDHHYFVVVSERGNLQTNKPEDTIWLFDVAKIRKFVSSSGQGSVPAPVPLVTVSSKKDGPFIHDVRWLPDSSRVVFTQPIKGARTSFNQLFLIDVRSHNVKALTPEDQDVTEFDANSESSYVYEVKAPRLLVAPPENVDTPIVQTGKTSVGEVLFPSEVLPELSPFPQAGLWLVTDGKPRQVLGTKDQVPAHIRLSPGARSLLGTLTVDQPPSLWSKYHAATVYHENFSDQFKFTAKTTYFLFDLENGSRKQLCNAPSGAELGWYSSFDFDSRWSSDGKSLVLSNVFLPLDNPDANENAEREKHPYVSVYRLDTGNVSGLTPVVSGYHSDRYFLADAFFQGSKTVVLKFDKKAMHPPLYEGPSIAVFHEGPEGSWKKVEESDDDPRLAGLPIQIEEREGINQPPIVVATDRATKKSYTVWDPNPQLKNIDLGDAKVVTLENLPGFPSKQDIGLVFPPDYVPGKCYPLVIQTHGFTPHQFLTSGVFTTPFAARAMAGRGIIVAQIEGIDDLGYKQGVLSFDSVIEKLSNQGLIDPTKVGAIGFSSPVRVVMGHMAFGKHRLAAAAILDGVDGGYLQSTLWLGLEDDSETTYSNGGTLFGGEGLKNWVARSPLFNTDKMKSPLLILEFKPGGVLEQWEEYSLLYQEHKPVELITLPPPYEHPSTNPRNRLYCETFATDWFDFWLNNHEDPDSAKAEQYKRWREMRKMQEETRRNSQKPQGETKNEN